jgi:hypothetical protein
LEKAHRFPTKRSRNLSVNPESGSPQAQWWSNSQVNATVLTRLLREMRPGERSAVSIGTDAAYADLPDSFYRQRFQCPATSSKGRPFCRTLSSVWAPWQTRIIPPSRCHSMLRFRGSCQWAGVHSLNGFSQSSTVGRNA